jgi:uncharacterized membrane protein YczE
MKYRDLMLRALMMVTGLSLIGLGIAMFVEAGLGADPVTVLCQGISTMANISLGRALQLNGVALFIVLLIAGRSYIGLGTFVASFTTGAMADVFEAVIPSPATPWQSWIMLLASIAVVSSGVAIYLSAKLGDGPLEGVMMLLSDRLKAPIAWVKIGMDVASTVAGFAMGAIPGIGTVVSVILTGPIIQALLKLIAESMAHSA